MTEGVKTLIYLGAALLVALTAFISRPRIEEFKASEQEGKTLFAQFDDPAKADRLEIIKYDEALGTLDEFRVARDKATNAWTLPSHGGYPADAESRMRDAALLLVDLQILGVASEVSGDHALFGVVEPNKDKLKVGDEGVGMLVRFEDAKGQNLASLIISSKKVKGADDQRFVRVPGQDVVYTVKIDPDKLSTKFQDWIEKDLLKELKSWDVEDIAIKNYTASLGQSDRGMAVKIDKKFELAADFKDSEWKLRELKKFGGGEEALVTLGDDEELNKDKLNDFKTAVDELEIGDVRRKPKGLGADLKAGSGYAKDDEGFMDLVKHGFYMVPNAGGEVELISANGEFSVGTKDGVEYILRFGETEKGGDQAPDEGKNRYLFVTARVDMDKFPQPDLEALPELPAGKNAASPDGESQPTDAAKSNDAAPAKPEAKTSDEPSDAPQPKPAETASETAKPSASDEPGSASPAGESQPEAEAKPAAEPAHEAAPPAAADSDSKAENKPEGDVKKTTDSQPQSEAKPEAMAPEPAQPEAKATTKTDTEAQEARIEKERERISKENQRKIDERNDKLKAAQEKVAKENTRFADWYYLVSDKQFSKLQLNVDDVIKKKTETKDAAKPADVEGEGIDAFRDLQSQGLQE